MHNTVSGTIHGPFTTRGYELDIFLCAYVTVHDWKNPILRNPFWRCYLPVTEGASICSSTATWPMHENNVIIIPPESAASGHADEPFTLFYAHFNCSINLASSAPLTCKVSPSIRADLDKAAVLRSKPRFRAAFLQLVTSALSSIPETGILSRVTDQRVEQAGQIMQENVHTVLSNTSLARQLSMSPSSLLRMFRKTVGRSPGQEHLRIRLHHAATLLQHTTKSIDQIADACGFWDRNHFTRVFTREWKTTPVKYRNSSTSL